MSVCLCVCLSVYLSVCHPASCQGSQEAASCDVMQGLLSAGDKDEEGGWGGKGWWQE